MANEELQQAIAWFENRLSAAVMPGAREMFGIALSALREKLERENPKPLTLDEMNALDHEPIYVLHTGGKWTMNGWHIATASSYQNHGRCDLEIDNGNTTIDTQNYGKTWLAYCQKPEEKHER